MVTVVSVTRMTAQVMVSILRSVVTENVSVEINSSQVGFHGQKLIIKYLSRGYKIRLYHLALVDTH